MAFPFDDIFDVQYHVLTTTFVRLLHKLKNLRPVDTLATMQAKDVNFPLQQVAINEIKIPNYFSSGVSFYLGNATKHQAVHLLPTPRHLPLQKVKREK